MTLQQRQNRVELSCPACTNGFVLTVQIGGKRHVGPCKSCQTKHSAEAMAVWEAATKVFGGQAKERLAEILLHFGVAALHELSAGQCQQLLGDLERRLAARSNGAAAEPGDAPRQSERNRTPGMLRDFLRERCAR